MNRLFYCFFCVSCLFNIFLHSNQPEEPVSRIQTLLPNLNAPFNVQLYLPQNYALILQENNEYFIGPHTVEKSFMDNLENFSSIKEPMLQVMKQEGMKSFEEDGKIMISQMKQQFPRNFEVKFFQWGNYPLASWKMTVGQDVIYMALVGLNDPAGTSLIFRLIYPSAKEFGNGNNPRREDLTFWQNFLNKTISLN